MFWKNKNRAWSEFHANIDISICSIELKRDDKKLYETITRSGDYE